MSAVSSNVSEKRRMTDGTGTKELIKALSTYLNQTGAGDYNLPRLIGDRVTQSTKKTSPAWSFQSRNKLGWYVCYHNNNHFLGT